METICRARQGRQRPGLARLSLRLLRAGSRTVAVKMLLWIAHFVLSYYAGHCGVTDRDRGGSECTLADEGAAHRGSGSWALQRASSWAQAVSVCYTQCLQCSHCRFFSVSLREADCSWFSNCDLDALNDYPASFCTFSMSHTNTSELAYAATHLQSIPEVEHSGHLNNNNVPCRWASARIRRARWRMCVYPSVQDTYLSAALAKDGCWECDMVSQMTQTLELAPGSILIDIGGNLGMYSLAAAAIGHASHVFEAVPLNSLMLDASIRRNNFGNLVTLYPTALGSHAGSLAMGRMINNQGGAQHTKGPGRVQVPVLRLDDVLPPLAAPIFIKIDIEGSECDAVAGMQRFLSDSRTQLLGAAIEVRILAHDCCLRWLQAPHGFYYLLATVHGLCAFIHQSQSESKWLPVKDIERLCDPGTRIWDVVWRPCRRSNAGQ